MPESPHSSESLSSPCAEQLHDLAGSMLLFYSRHNRLPQRLEDLSPVKPAEALSLRCPVSNLPYSYAPDGVALSGYNGRLLVWDTQPCHNGSRWAIVDIASANSKTITLRVVLWSESEFANLVAGSVR